MLSAKQNGMADGRPISIEQQRLWVLQQLEHARTAFNVPVFLRLRGRLHKNFLESSLLSALHRHPILNSTFAADKGQLLQIERAAPSAVLNFMDLTALPEAEREDRLQRLAMQEQHAAFDLETAPPLRATLLRVASHDHVLLLNVHHIASDRTSAHLLLAEIAHDYNHMAGSDDRFQPGKVQYTDYIAWQREYLNSEAAAHDIEFWKGQMEGAPTGIELPTDHPRPPEPSFQGQSRPIPLPALLTARLQELACRYGTSVRVLLLSSLVALLCRYTGLDDIVVGTEVEGRTLEGTQDAIGPFARDLVLRVDTSGKPTFRELISRVQKTLMAAESHQHLPFAKLLDCLHVERDLSRNPLFQVKFAQASILEMPAFRGLHVTALPIHTVTEILDLTLGMVERKDGFDLSFSYSTDLFSESTVERMCTHLQLLLRALCNDDASPIFELPMLTEGERQHLVADCNRTAMDYPKQCIHQLFELQVQTRPSAQAVICGGRTLTYAQLNGRANQLARYLRKRGIGPDTLVGIYLDRSPDMLVALMGVLKAGAAYVPLDPAYPRERIAFIVQDANIPLVLSQQELVGSLPARNAQVICLDTDWASIANEDASNLAIDLNCRNLAYVLYTSGSTGIPKGVEIEHLSVVNFLMAMRHEPGFGRDDVLLAVTTLSFDIAGLELYLPLATGGRIVLASREEATDGAALQRLLNQGITVMQATPATWRLLLESGWPGNGGLKILCGGEALPRQLAQQLLPRCRELWNMYGPTETTIWSSLCRVTDVSWSVAPIGKPIGNTQMYVLDKRRQVLPVGVAGELYIGGDGLARGYRNRPELTSEKFVYNPFSQQPTARLYVTGDLVRFLSDGNIQYLGRIDDQVKVRGFRIELGEIETVLAQHPAVLQAVAVVREESGDKQIIAYVSPQKEHQVDVADVRAFAKQKLPEYMLPSRFVTLNQFPLTPNGKIDRKALPAPAREISLRVREVQSDELEAKLVSIFEAILGVQPVEVTDDFFELGGHSIMAARLITEIRKLTGRQLPLNTLFHAANVRYLRKVLAEEVKLDSESIVTQIQAGNSSSPPFFAVISPGESGLGYAILARQMGSAYPFYQLQADSPIAIERPYTWDELDNLAEQYVGAMRRVQSRGPYFFGAMCDGAHIAIRMARKLEQSGETVGLLGIFDTWVLEDSQHPLLWRLYYYSERFRQFRTWSLDEQFDAFYRTAGRLTRRILGQKKRSAWSHAYWPAKDYVPPQINSRVTLFRRPKQPYYYKRDPLMGWGKRTTGSVDVQVLPINHQEMLREPSVQVLAPALVACLRKATLSMPMPEPATEAVDVPQVRGPAKSLSEAL